MFKFLLVIVTLFISNIADARPRGINSSQGGFVSGNAQLNINTSNPSQFINILKSATLSFANPADAALLDTDGYIVGTPSGNVSFINMSSNAIYSGVTYKINFTGSITTRVNIGSAITGCVASGTASFTGCTGVSGVITNSGGVGAVTFTLPSGGFSAFLPSGFAHSRSSGEIAVYRLSDETDYLNGEIWSPEHRAALTSLRSGTSRTMGLSNVGGTGNFNGETTWANRIKLTDFTWNTFKIPPRIWGGTISGTDTYTGASAPSTPVSYTDGEQYIGITTNANTSASVTINIGGRGAKNVVTKDTAALGTGCAAGSNACIRANTIGTFTYDALLDKFLYNSNGVTAAIPLEAQIDIANKTNTNLWALAPAWALDDYVTNWATLICTTASSSTIPRLEYSNEMWNSSFSSTQWASARGQALGWTLANGQAVYGWYGLRTRQLMGNVIPSACGSRQIYRVLAYQAAGDTTNQTNRFQGSQLCPSSGGVGCGNALYDSWTSSANYTTVGQRPIDVVEVLASAPYAGGANLCLGVDSPTCTPTAANAAFYQCLVNAVEGGSTVGCASSNPTVASPTPVNLVDDDIRQGRSAVQTVTCVGTTCTTPIAHGFTAGSTNISFQVIGGTSYSGLVDGMLYGVASTPTSTTFTFQAYSGGRATGSAVDVGSAGTGTVSVGISNAGMIYSINRWIGFNEANAALYDAQRGSLPPLRVEQYEGNLEPLGPSAAQCTTLGITGTDCSGSISAAIVAWMQDNKASLTQQSYFKRFMGTDATYTATFGIMSHSRIPSQLTVYAPSCASNVPSTSLPWQSLSIGCLPDSGLSKVGIGYQSFSTP